MQMYNIIKMHYTHIIDCKNKKGDNAYNMECQNSIKKKGINLHVIPKRITNLKPTYYPFS